jgi:AAA domain
MSILAKVTNTAPNLPSRVVLYAAEKWGKSSFAAHAPKPLFLMTAGETGLLSLIEARKVPAVDHFPDDFQTWQGLISAVRALRDEKHEFQTLVLDTGNGAENLAADAVCVDKFGGDWSDFNAYGRGIDLTVPEWAKFLALLDDLRIQKRMGILFLHHARVKTFSDPAGKQWDQWRPEAREKLWGLTHKWSDCILFGGWQVTVSKDAKATGEERYLRSGTSGAVVAGNRYGLPDTIKAPADAGNLWRTFAEALKKAKTPAAA